MLGLVPALKQRLNKLINGSSQTNRDQKLNLINLRNYDSNLLKIDKNLCEGIYIYYLGYITIKKIDDCKNIYSVNPLYLLVNHASEYIKEKNGNKCLIFDNSLNENKALLNKYADVWDGIKAINGDEEKNYEKDYMKIKLNPYDNLPLNKPVKCHEITIIIRSVLGLYPQVFLGDTLYEL